VVNGSTEVLVSDVNGDVKVGDKITASMISGVGMKAVGPGEIVGTVQAALGSVKTVSRTVSDQTGKSRSVKIGLLPVAVNVTHYTPIDTGDRLSAYIPIFMQTAADNVAGKHVAALRVVLAAGALILGFLTVVIMVQTAIRSGIISLGRNPLAQQTLRRGLRDALIAAVAVLVVTAVATYGLLIV